MSTRQALLDALENGPVSGPALATELGVSRAAVWKAVETLREDGFAVDSTADGYVAPSTIPYSATGIAYGLDAPYTVEYHESVTSTNQLARKRAKAGEADLVVVAGEQTAGRGRLEREWVSPPGGVWLSLLTRPAVTPAEAPVFTLAAAVATADACRDAGVDAVIKWPNDVLVTADTDMGTRGSQPTDDRYWRGGKKVAGILTEMEGEADRVSWIIVGVGVNVNVPASSLPPGATSLSVERMGAESVEDTSVDRRRFVQHFLERYHELAESTERILPAWRDRSCTLGARVRVETPNEVVVGTAVNVERPGALIVETDDGRRRLTTGDCEHLRSAHEES